MRFKIFSFLLLFSIAMRGQETISSPSKKISVQLNTVAGGKIKYSVKVNNKEVLVSSALGLVRSDIDFSEGLVLLKADPVQSITDKYTMVYAKKSSSNYKANKRVFHFSKNGSLMDIIFQVSNDGVAFRYHFPKKPASPVQLTSERTTFHFPISAKAWLQPMQVAKTGWESSNPAYEENYQQGIPVGTTSTLGVGWVYPALFQSNDNWVLITEAGLDTRDCATRLESESPDGEYKIGYPDPREVFAKGEFLTKIDAPYYTPWRIVTIGNLATIMESTLGTDLAKPSVLKDISYIKPGKASWSWINSKDDFIVYDEQKKYIDFAASMHWQYCLVDAWWDRNIGYDRMKELADYAKTKKVDLLLWYNSSGDWNTIPHSPKSKLLTHESRMSEFKRLQAMGIKGLKIDFFGGDGQSMIAYYIDILKDAAACELMINFHGATLPRGWQRTYPNLLTAEAVKGFEMITFDQADADREANHCAMLPFTRNVFDPMDFTPMNLHKIQTKVVRKTNSSFELALSVIFLSGIQHFAESPEGMQQVPNYVQDFLRELPVAWDEVKFIDGYPGKYLVLARKKGTKWYISGINSENTAKSIEINPELFGAKKGTLISDGTTQLSFKQTVLDAKQKQTIVMQPSGGFVLVYE